ncbi:O-methyltransferase [Mycena maculata]|uniref:O-methyltransferase n=1 Tax=Mycena maculata TaxID=230809 RepID=A0AAD7ISK0_9AGAR|nr:O-methyltransferase [Mycena maculata]
MAATLIELCGLISSSVATVDARCKAMSCTYPNLNDPAISKDAARLLEDSEVSRATSIALAAASQLIATMQYPSRVIVDTSLGFLLSAALGVVAASSTAEIIREAGPEGCHINDIAKKNGMDPAKIARVLRPLATQHIFREISPNVFAHNRVSAVLDTGKNLQDILAAPEDKHHGAIGYSALVGLNTDETFKAAAYIQDVVLKPNAENEEDEFNTPLNKAFNTHIDLFSWYELPENKMRFKRFGMAMDASRRMSPLGPPSQGFKWASLPGNTLIVDVGGGIGSVSLEIARRNPCIRFIIQDKASVVREGQEHWEKTLPGAMESGKVSFQAHDFFMAQPVKNADIFVLRFICHDWSDSYTLRILKHLREAAQDTTRLIVLEYILPFACAEDETYRHIPGAIPPDPPPKPLLANKGIVGMVRYLVDMQMMVLLNGCDRTFPHYWNLFREAGWEIEQVYHPAGTQDQLIAKPI